MLKNFPKDDPEAPMPPPHPDPDHLWKESLESKKKYLQEIGVYA